MPEEVRANTSVAPCLRGGAAMESCRLGRASPHCSGSVPSNARRRGSHARQRKEFKMICCKIVLFFVKRNPLRKTKKNKRANNEIKNSFGETAANAKHHQSFRKLKLLQFNALPVRHNLNVCQRVWDEAFLLEAACDARGCARTPSPRRVREVARP
jgi:hypothetical protein